MSLLDAVFLGVGAGLLGYCIGFAVAAWKIDNRIPGTLATLAEIERRSK
jgi:hypothetical protein